MKPKKTRTGQSRPVLVEIDPSMGDKKTRSTMNARRIRVHVPNAVSARGFHIDVTYEDGVLHIMGSDAFDIIPHVSNHISISKRGDR